MKKVIGVVLWEGHPYAFHMSQKNSCANWGDGIFILASEGMNSFVINPLCSAHPTFLLWRLSSVSERGSKTGPDRSSYHTLRQIAHGLFGEALPPFGIPHIFQSIGTFFHALQKISSQITSNHTFVKFFSRILIIFTLYLSESWT